MTKEQLEGEYISIRNRGIRISLFSTVTIIGVFVLYGYLVRPENFVFSSKIIRLISDLGMAVFVSLLGALLAIGYGIYLICISERMRIVGTIHSENEVENRSSSIISIVVNIISQTKYMRVFLLVLFAYAVLFSFVSQIIIFRPDVSFSHVYGVTIPSWKITPCCNTPGFVPIFTAYLSDNLIIFIIPVNLVLAVVLSTLVGVNIALAAYTFQNRAKKIKMNNKSNILYSGGLGGATTGLLTACPICAGTFFSTIVGLVIGASSASALAGVVTATTTLAPFQMLFIIISIPTLLISPYLTIKSLRK